MRVTCLVWIAHKLASLNRLITYASATSCKMRRVNTWNLRSPYHSWVISLTHLVKGNLLIRNLVDSLNLQISHRATVPGQSLLLLFSFPLSSTSAIFFPLSLTFSFSFNSGTLHHLHFFVSHMYLLLLIHSITQTILLSLTLQYLYTISR